MAKLVGYFWLPEWVSDLVGKLAGLRVEGEIFREPERRSDVRLAQKSADCCRAWFLGFAGYRASNGAGRCESRGRWDDCGGRYRGVGQEVGDRLRSARADSWVGVAESVAWTSDDQASSVPGWLRSFPGSTDRLRPRSRDGGSRHDLAWPARNFAAKNETPFSDIPSGVPTVISTW